MQVMQTQTQKLIGQGRSSNSPESSHTGTVGQAIPAPDAPSVLTLPGA
jgi:hypothetical protein